MDRGDALLGIDVPCDRVAPAAIRDALSEIEGVGWVLGDAMLVASELVSNAVMHSGAGPGDMLHVSVSRGAAGLTISVSDPGYSGKEAAITPHEEAAVGGLGLRVVEAIARRWGAERGPGYRVWASFPITDRPAAQRL